MGVFKGNNRNKTDSNQIQFKNKSSDRLVSASGTENTREKIGVVSVKRKYKLFDCVEHYMPPKFPYVIDICQEDVNNFRDLWILIYAEKNIPVGQQSKLSELFDIFYYHLFSRSTEFRSFFGTNFKERCRIITRQMTFFTTIKMDGDVEGVFRHLGRIHLKFNVSNWQYATFIEVLLECLFIVLKDDADLEKIRSSVKVVGFGLYMTLKHAITKESFDPLDMNVNWTIQKKDEIKAQLEEEKKNCDDESDTMDTNLRLARPTS